MKSCFLELESFDEFIISGDIYSYLILNRKTQAKTELKKKMWLTGQAFLEKIMDYR